MFYSGKAHCVSVSCVFIVSTEGTILWANVNQPGSWHDMKVCEPLLIKLRENPCLLPEGWAILGDVGFRSHATEDIFLTVHKHGESSTTLSKEAQAFLTKIRQGVEWSIKDFKRYYPRLKTDLPVDKDERAAIFETCVLLWNYRMRRVGAGSQVRSVYHGAEARALRARALLQSCGFIGFRPGDEDM